MGTLLGVSNALQTSISQSHETFSNVTVREQQLKELGELKKSRISVLQMKLNVVTNVFSFDPLECWSRCEVLFAEMTAIANETLPEEGKRVLKLEDGSNKKH